MHAFEGYFVSLENICTSTSLRQLTFSNLLTFSAKPHQKSPWRRMTRSNDRYGMTIDLPGLLAGAVEEVDERLDELELLDL